MTRTGSVIWPANNLRRRGSDLPSPHWRAQQGPQSNWPSCPSAVNVENGDIAIGDAGFDLDLLGKPPQARSQNDPHARCCATNGRQWCAAASEIRCDIDMIHSYRGIRVSTRRRRTVASAGGGDQRFRACSCRCACAPNSRIRTASACVRTPPAALTCMVGRRALSSGPRRARWRRDSCSRRRAAAQTRSRSTFSRNPAPYCRHIRQSSIFERVVGQEIVFENHFHDRTGRVRHLDDGANIRLDIVPVTAQHLACLTTMSSSVAPCRQASWASKTLTSVVMRTVRKTDTVPTATELPASSVAASGTAYGLMQTLATPNSIARWQPVQLVVGEHRGQQRIINHPGDTCIHRGTLRGRATMAAVARPVIGTLPGAVARL